jgi:hypothetical protein
VNIIKTALQLVIAGILLSALAFWGIDKFKGNAYSITPIDKASTTLTTPIKPYRQPCDYTCALSTAKYTDVSAKSYRQAKIADMSNYKRYPTNKWITTQKKNES